jgi:hypothetical protein
MSRNLPSLLQLSHIIAFFILFFSTMLILRFFAFHIQSHNGLPTPASFGPGTLRSRQFNNFYQHKILDLFVYQMSSPSSLVVYSQPNPAFHPDERRSMPFSSYSRYTYSIIHFCSRKGPSWLMNKSLDFVVSRPPPALEERESHSQNPVIFNS